MRIRVLILALALSGAALGQEELAPARRGELGVRYWLSTGETRHSHNAQGFEPAAGNPTSILTYSNLDANVFELHGRENFGEKGFIKGNLGVGLINTGSFDDEDYLAGQFKFLDTTSSVTEGRIGYFTLDLGRRLWTRQGGGGELGVFVGFSQWTEDVDAYGATITFDFFDAFGNAPDTLLVISNKARWRALRLGLTGNLLLGWRTRLDLDVAFIPYAQLRNEDSHHLRTDPSDPDFFLGPVPNIIHDGRGRGVQLEAEVRHQLMRRTEIAVGFRYWYLESTNGERQVPGRTDTPDFPIVEFYSKRVGVTLSVRRIW